MRTTSITRLVMAVLSATVFLSASAATAQKKGTACPSPTPQPDTTCYAGSGCLDVNFGVSGIVTSYLNSQTENVFEDVFMQPDGKIVGVGNTTGTIIVARFNPDGSFDTTFGDPDPLNPMQRLGYASIQAGPNSIAHTGAVQADGKIVVGGVGHTPDGLPEGAVLRLNSNGTLDPTFDGDGILILSDIKGAVNDLAIQSDQRILLVFGDRVFNVRRLNSDGSLDTTFGTGGTTTANPSTRSSGSGSPQSLAIQRIPAVTGEERIVVGGYAQPSSGGAWTYAMMRFKPNGAIDTSFGSGGRVLTAIGANDRIFRVGIDSQNRIVAAGNSWAAVSTCTKSDFSVARYTENGILDTSFSGDGKWMIDVSNSDNQNHGLVIQSDDKIVVGGRSERLDPITNYNESNFNLIRLNSDGTPDAGFGPGYPGPGIVVTNIPGGANDYLYGMAAQPDGKIVVGGSSYLIASDGTQHGRVALARYWP